MPAWPGGDCPECGEEMPANLVHCQMCRALLNPELERPEIEVPEFQPLREVNPNEEVKDVRFVRPQKFFVNCIRCQQELKIAARYLDHSVLCNFCDYPFDVEFHTTRLTLLGVETDCPHCNQTLRAANQYLGHTVACNFCTGKLSIIRV